MSLSERFLSYSIVYGGRLNHGDDTVLSIKDILHQLFVYIVQNIKLKQRSHHLLINRNQYGGLIIQEIGRAHV